MSRALLPLLVLLSLPTFAAEIPLTPAVAGPAALSQYSAVVASDGDGYLVLWTDQRSGGDTTRATRVTADGEVLDPTGIELLRDAMVAPSVVWTGSSYLVVWGTYGPDRMWALRIDRDGTIIDPPRVLIQGVHPSDAVRNGSQIAVAYRSQFNTALGAVVLDSEGRQVADVEVAAAPTGTQGYVPAQLAANGDAFVAMWMTILEHSYESPIHLEAARFDADGKLHSAPRLLVDDKNLRNPAIASDGDAFLIVTGDYPTERYSARRVSADLLTVSAPVLLPESIRSSVSVVWTGARYVVVGENGALLTGVPIDRDGHVGAAAVVENVPFSGLAAGPVAATNGRDLFVAWNGSTQINDATLTDVFGTVVDEPSLGRRNRALLSRSASRQTRPLVAAGDDNVLAIWTEGSSMWAKRLQHDGSWLDVSPLRIAGNGSSTPAVAFNGTDYVVAWFDIITHELVTRRIPAAGALRVEEGESTFVNLWVDSLAVASDGSSTLLAWSDSRHLRVAKVDASAAILDEVFLDPAEDFFSRIDMAAGDRGQFLLTWGELRERASHHDTPQPVSIRAARITGDLLLLDSNGFDVATDTELERDPSVTWNGEEWLVAWTRGLRSDDEIRGRRVARNGMLRDGVAGDGGVLIQSDAVLTEVVSDGGRYLLSFTDLAAPSRLRTSWLPHLGAATTAMRDLGEAPPEWTPSIALASISVRPGAPLAVYTRLAPEPHYGGVARAFATAIGFPAGRRRSVR